MKKETKKKKQGSLKIDETKSPTQTAPTATEMSSYPYCPTRKTCGTDMRVFQDGKTTNKTDFRGYMYSL